MHATLIGTMLLCENRHFMEVYLKMLYFTDFDVKIKINTVIYLFRCSNQNQ